MNWHEILAWLLAALVTALHWVWRNRQVLLLRAAEAVAFAEKYFSGASNTELEDEAVTYFKAHWPQAPAVVVRLALREICWRRKAGAAEMVKGAGQ